ncbi:MAG: putative molybdenum carrier protein [Desulfobacterales bacterium]|jgi:hypothetical protein
MLKKIISGGQTGADRAALDVAIELGIPHGGWISKGRLAEDGPLSEKYQLQEMPTDSHPERTEKNVQDSDGTLIIARGKLSGGTDYTRQMTLKHKKQLLGIDLNLISHFDAASLVASWIRMQRIGMLNVAGPKASKDSAIYGDVLKILENAIQILKDEERRSRIKPQQTKPKEAPKTVDETVDILTNELPLKDKNIIANMAEGDLIDLHSSLGLSIRNRFLYPRNEKLLEACRQEAKDKYLHWDQASGVIIKELWKRLKESHKMRVVK